MCFGGTRSDRIQINDDTCWSGSPADAYGPPDIGPQAGAGPKILNRIREALSNGDEVGAELASLGLQSGYSQSYQPFVDLWLETPDSAEAADYSRSLDLRDGVAMHTWRSGSAVFEQRTFASYVDQGLVCYRECTTHQPFDVWLDLTSSHPTVSSERDSQGRSLAVRMPTSVLPPHANSDHPIERATTIGAAVTAVARLEVRTDGRLHDDGLVSGASWVLLVLTSETDYSGYEADLHGDVPMLIRDASRRAGSVADRGFRELILRHVADHSDHMSRVQLTLDSEASTLPTDERIQAATRVRDPGLAALAFNYGRYLLLASSRPGSRPAHLQGIWNEKLHPPWSSNYTININLEMNYWAAEATALGDCSEPLLDFISALARRGRVTARELYDLPGWVAHHNSDIWGFSVPAGLGEGDPAWSMWPLAGGWLSRHLWERWEFEGDVEELRERLWPIMRGAAEFVVAWLVHSDGMQGTAPSTSPENHFIGFDGGTHAISTSTTADLAIIRDLYTNCLGAAEVLGIDDDLCAAMRRGLVMLPRERVQADGRIAEWSEPYADAEPLHRHQSHLYGVMPGESILPERDLELSTAALGTLNQRGPKSTGWSLAWRVALRARLLDAETALSTLDDFLLPMPDGASDEPSMSAPSGVYRNLFCAHPPFQIDGNLAITASIGEMLFQSHGGRLRLLPALPSQWANGELHGIRGRGGFTVDISWRDGLLGEARMLSTTARSARVLYGDQERVVEFDAGTPLVLTHQDFLTD
jgi:alpha-L-fucosidase 2